VFERTGMQLQRLKVLGEILSHSELYPRYPPLGVCIPKGGGAMRCEEEKTSQGTRDAESENPTVTKRAAFVLVVGDC
jgi:hypothetical protein